MSENYIWRCNGECRALKPKCGWFYSKEDRSPGPHCGWWARHQRRCSGNFQKLTKADVMRECELDSRSESHGESQIFENAATVDMNRNATLIQEISLDTGRNSDSILIIDEDCNIESETSGNPVNQIKFINDGIGNSLDFMHVFGLSHTIDADEVLICAICNEKLLNEHINGHLKACTGLCLDTIKANNQLAIFVLPIYKFNSNTN